MARLLLLTASDLARDPRARRARLTADRLGWQVAVVSLGPPTAPRSGVHREGGVLRELRGDGAEFLVVPLNASEFQWLTKRMKKIPDAPVYKKAR